ncbi:MAG: hypothetical protein ABFD79_09040 [Phycisphaerales bacterium]
MNNKKILLVLIMILLARFSYAQVMLAQPETRHLYDPATSTEPLVCELNPQTNDPNVWIYGHTWPTTKRFGALVIAFKLPQLPEGYTIKTASFNWFYVEALGTWSGDHDLYGLGYRPAGTNPLVTINDYYVGNTVDTSDATLIQTNITNTQDIKAYNEWRKTDPNSKAIASYIQAQYDNGAKANDWILLRINRRSISKSTAIRHVIKSARDPNFAPYIEFEMTPYKTCTIATPYVLRNNGLDTVLNGKIDIGCCDITGSTDPNLKDFRDGVAIFPFKIPQLKPGERVISANLSCMAMYYPNKEQIDLYGLSFRNTPDYVSSDYWINFYAPLSGENPNGTPISGNIFSDVNVAGISYPWLLDSEGQQRLACYINNQIAAGATSNSYMFLRMNHRYAMAPYKKYHRTEITSPYIEILVGTTAPVCPAAPDSEPACPQPLDHHTPFADVNNDCKVDMGDLSLLFENWLECTAEPSEYYCF